MKLLLDTHVLLWSLLDPGRLATRVAAEIDDPENELWLSPITTWETIVLIQKGRLVVNSNPETWIKSVLVKIPFREAPINHEVAIQSRVLRLSHEDPADRFLVATALVYGLTLVTADERLLNSEQCSVLPAG
jgi:PIN domain nuclease of toxin-antitoxin system